ncbi:MAG: hypothetical protein RL258_317 [Pseudomonadota bacterium]
MGARDATRARAVASGLLSLVALNALLSFTAWWPTPAVLPDLRIAPEFVLLWLTVLLLVSLRGALLPRILQMGLTLLYLVFILARYLDVTAPSLFGRAVSLYWDIPQIPRFVWVWASDAPWWASLGALLITGVLLALLAQLVFRGIGSLAADIALPYARRASTWVITALATGLIAANYAGVQATWPYVSKPVIPTYWKQLSLIWDAQSPEALAQALPSQTPIERAMARSPTETLDLLGRRDVMVVFLESFGAFLYDHPEAVAATSGARAQLDQTLKAGGHSVVTGFFRSPTVGGASDLAHMSVLSGVDLSDPRRHDLLLTTERPTLMQLFRTRGYETFGLYHAVAWPWPERHFYGFTHYLDGPALDYRGPPLGFWSIPDQFALARFDQLYPRKPDTPPRLVFFPTITSHLPFSPVPPYQPDWDRILTDTPFDPESLAAAQTEKPNWLNMRPDYLRMVNYVYQWLSGYFARPETRETVYVLIGDHQPTANVTGEGASWDVPVHVISRDPRLLQPLEARGFIRGLDTRQNALGGLHALPEMLLDAWSSAGPPSAPETSQGGIRAATTVSKATPMRSPP